MASLGKWGLVGLSYLQWPFEALYIKCRGGSIEQKVELKFYFEFCNKWLTVPKGFRHDWYSWSPNLWKSVAAIFHDFAFAFGQWDDGSKISFNDSVRIIIEIMKSEDWPKITVAKYAAGVRSLICRGMWSRYRDDDPLHKIRYTELTGKTLHD